ncbi:hypothetical protein AMQ84_05950 [Paenibacillus riograndensis]|uniref:Exosporium protein C n=2 Tax=Paenibacillus sonchi group TaxID=2044880 RepID=A0A132U8E8_9BACL|nr:hypothetical protein [Paenibacillus riograndensis]KWX79656.1 hypothetical protein AMQ84_05950 [Paenibacillus riograndensis]KWX85457.1 hypothetical protein AMQ83_24620 [Paenibacillus riograndensis]
MGIQFLDMRISRDSAADQPGVSLSSSSFPYIFGDIGLQTGGIAPGNASLVRVTLNAYARLTMAISSNPAIVPDATFTIFRNSAQIFTTVYQKPASQAMTELTYEMAGITAVDFPPAADVLAGQIRYIISVTTNYGVTLGARSFSGIAVAGNG